MLPVPDTRPTRRHVTRSVGWTAPVLAAGLAAPVASASATCADTTITPSCIPATNQGQATSRPQWTLISTDVIRAGTQFCIVGDKSWGAPTATATPTTYLSLVTSSTGWCWVASQDIPAGTTLTFAMDFTTKVNKGEARTYTFNAELFGGTCQSAKTQQYDTAAGNGKSACV